MTDHASNSLLQRVRVFTSLSLPIESLIQSFLHRFEAAPFTYEALEATKNDTQIPNGYVLHYQKVCIGHGHLAFERAKNALKTWQAFPHPWTGILPKTELSVDQDVVMYFRLFGLYWLNSCRVVYIVEEADTFGFAYGTTPGHMGTGEELFAISIDKNEDVWYEIKAFAKPYHPFAKLAYPLMRLLQERFRRDSADQMKYIVKGQAGAGRLAWSPDYWFSSGLATIASLVFLWPDSIYSHELGLPILAFALILFMPFVTRLWIRHDLISYQTKTFLKQWLPPSLLLATVSLFIPQGWWATVLSAPLALLSIATFAKNLPHRIDLVSLTKFSILVNWIVASLTLASDRAGYDMLPFGAEILRLTALHFHFAGVGLLTSLAVLYHKRNGLLESGTLLTFLLAVPFTALGITLTYFGINQMVEVAAGVTTSIAGVGIGMALVKTMTRTGILSGTVLLVTMILAAAYASRHIIPDVELTIHQMRVWHGTINAIIVVPFGLWAAHTFASEIQKNEAI